MTKEQSDLIMFGWLFIIFFVGGFVLFIGFIVYNWGHSNGMEEATEEVHDEAVDEGVAEYFIEPENNCKTFRWKKP